LISWSRSFSSIYGEWETTSEASRINRSFHESVRFPLPDELFDVVFKKRDAATPLPTTWPKKAFEEHSIAVQERRAQMRRENVSEEKMNELFRYTKEYAEALFEESGQEGIVGAFEGGNYAAEGYYRSEQNCLMFTRTENFCAVCAEAIGKVIDEYTETQ